MDIASVEHGWGWDEWSAMVESPAGAAVWIDERPHWC